MALYNYCGPLAPGLNFVKNSLTYVYSLFISSSALHLLAERLASVTADTSFTVFGLTRLRVEPSLPASKANALKRYAMALVGLSSKKVFNNRFLKNRSLKELSPVAPLGSL